MALIYLETFILAPKDLVFDLSRSIDLHKFSMTQYAEEIIEATCKGLMQLNDEVTWKARHFFRNRKLKVRITELTKPHFFADEMIEGDFKRMRHEHYFNDSGDGCLMIDKFYFESPYAVIGKMANILFLKNYMTQLLHKRNSIIKNIAESDLRKQYLNND